VAVEAAAGYGKTTLLRQWLAVDPRASGWLTLTRADDDPAVLVNHLGAVLATLGVPVPPGPTVDVGAALAAVDHPVVLVLDDAHEVSSASSVAVLGTLVDGVPTGATVALAGRSLARLQLARRELAGQVLHLGSRTLAFGPEEATTALGPVAEAIGPDGVDRLLDLLHGWPTGIALASAVLEQQSDPQAALAGLATSRLVRDYVDQELLATHDEATREMFLRTAVLPQLSGPLCDAVLDASGSAARLAAMARTGDCFLTALEGDEAWYRFHPLVAEALVAELRRREPDMEAELHRRAARWWRTRRGADEAVHHALAAGDHDLAAAVVAESVFECLDRSRQATLQRWLDAFPEGCRTDHPELGLAAGWLALRAGRRDELQAWLDLLARRAPHLAVPRAALAMVGALDGIKQSIRDADVVLAAGRAGNEWWNSAVQIRVVARVAAGLVEGDERVAELTAALVEVGEEGLVAAVLEANLALAHYAMAHVDAGHEHSRRASARLAAIGGEADRLGAMVPGVAALSAALRGDREAALGRFAHIADVAERLLSVTPRGSAQVALVLADVAVLVEDRARADRALAIAVRAVADVPDAPLFERWLAGAEVRRAAMDVVADDPVGLTPAERRVLRELPTHRSLQEIADRVFVSRNTVKSHTVAIYRKLGVSGRSAAVTRAEELGLLDSPHRDDAAGGR